MSDYQSVPVRVNVYNLSSLNEYLNNIGFGVYHTGVEVFGIEYCYGGHSFVDSGIFEMTPMDCSMLCRGSEYKTSLYIGETSFSFDDIRLILQSMGDVFRGNEYHLLRKNCNHFSNALIQVLCGASLPKWINRLAYFSAKLPFIERSIPREWLTPNQLCTARMMGLHSRPRHAPASFVEEEDFVMMETPISRLPSSPLPETLSCVQPDDVQVGQKRFPSVKSLRRLSCHLQSCFGKSSQPRSQSASLGDGHSSE